MELLGSYNSSLTAAYYQELLDLLDKAISSGDLSGGSAFDKSSLLKLESQAQSFASLPLGSAGNRVMDNSFNYPLSLLEARLKALAAEAGNFTTVSGRLRNIMRAETRCLPSRGPSRHLSKTLPLWRPKRPSELRRCWLEWVPGGGRKGAGKGFFSPGLLPSPSRFTQTRTCAVRVDTLRNFGFPLDEQ